MSIRRLSKVEALRQIYSCAALYDKNLAGRSLLFVGSIDNNAEAYEAAFYPRNFLHLTGVISRLKGDRFYRALRENRMTIDDITLAVDGTTEQKLAVLPRLMSIHQTARMIGEYNHSRPLLIADKFAGTTTTAMGLTLVNDIYQPSSALQVDIRAITAKATRRRVIAILIKEQS